MKRSVGILSIAVVPVFVAGMVLAAEPYGAKAAESGATAGVAAFMGQHTMTGKITDIDREKGRVSIEAEGEKLGLHFPPTALQTLNVGDQVTVSLGIKPVRPTAGVPGTPGAGDATP